jgi:hypothetical protein
MTAQERLAISLEIARFKAAKPPSSSCVGGAPESNGAAIGF